MNLWTALAAVAVAASVFLFLQLKDRGAAMLAIVVGVLEVLLDSGIVHLSIRSVPLHLVLGGLLTIAGIFLYARVVSKIGAAASTIVFCVGALQVLTGLGLVL